MQSLNFSAHATYEALKNTRKIKTGLDIVFGIASESPQALISYFAFSFKIASCEICVQEILSSSVIIRSLETRTISLPEIVSFFVSDVESASIDTCIYFLSNADKKIIFYGRWKLRSIIFRKHSYYISALYRKGKWTLKSHAEDIEIPSWKKLIIKCFELNLRPMILLYAVLKTKTCRRT